MKKQHSTNTVLSKPLASQGNFTEKHTFALKDASLDRQRHKGNMWYVQYLDGAALG